MAGIFISYRREDAAPWAGRIYERLAHQIDRGQLFMDVDNIAPGMDFVRVLEDQVGACDVILVVIGKNWAEARNMKGQRRLDDPHDFVRIELETAVKRDIRVIPVLVDGAQMPASNDLPEGIRPLARRQAVELTHSRFGTDVQRLTDALVPLMRPSAAKPSATEVRSESPAPQVRPGKPKRIKLILRGLAGVITLAVFGVTLISLGASVFTSNRSEQGGLFLSFLGFGALSAVIGYGWYRYLPAWQAAIRKLITLFLRGLAALITLVVFGIMLRFLYDIPNVNSSQRGEVVLLFLGFGVLSAVIGYGWYRYLPAWQAAMRKFITLFLRGLAAAITLVAFGFTLFLLGLSVFGQNMTSHDRLAVFIWFLGFGTLSAVISYGWYKYFRARRARET